VLYNFVVLTKTVQGCQKKFAPFFVRLPNIKRVSVLKATIENKTTSVTTHFKKFFKKLTPGNNVFIASLIV